MDILLPNTRWWRAALLGPVALILAALFDLFLITRIFVANQAFVGVLAFFVFGAATGVPIQLVLGRIFGKREAAASGDYPRTAALTSGALAALATMAWIYTLRMVDAGIALPFASLTPLVFALYEGARRRIVVRRALPFLIIFVAGLFVVRSPGTAGAPFPSVVVGALVVKNLAAAGSEEAERHGHRGNVASFAAWRFVWLGVTGIPVALAALALLGGLADASALIVRSLPVALPIHTLTMGLTFFGAVQRTHAKRTWSMTAVTTMYTVPLVVTPLVAASLNRVVWVYPTASGSLRLFLGALLVVVAALGMKNAVRRQNPTTA